MDRVQLELVEVDVPNRPMRARRFIDARGMPASGPPAPPAFTGRY